VTERKPPGMNFPSWIDQQIHEAEERGAFDNLPGAGKPLPKRREADDGMAWLREFLRREGVSTDELLPAPLRLRKETERLAETVQDLHSEQAVRDAVAALNRQIIQWRRVPTGPPIFVRLLDAEAMVARWREAHRAAPPAPRPEDGGGTAADPAPARPRWWRRLSRRAGSGGTKPWSGRRSGRGTAACGSEGIADSADRARR
jgi:hypothetical protein